MGKLNKWLLSLLCLGGMVNGLMAAEALIKDLSSGAKNGKMVEKGTRTEGYFLTTVPVELSGLPTVFVPRGDGQKAGAGFSFVIDAPATVFLCVHNRGKASIPAGWSKTELVVNWEAAGNKLNDSVYRNDFPAGKVEIPAHDGTDGGMFGVPGLAVIKFATDTKIATVSANGLVVKELSNGGKIATAKLKAPRVTDEKYGYSKIPAELENLVCVYVPRGDSAKEGIAYSFVIDKSAVVYLLVHNRGSATIPAGWLKTELKTVWTTTAINFDDAVYKKEFPAGKVEIPGHNGKDAGGSYGIPNAAIIQPK